MKTITISDKSYKFVKNLINEINTQDNRFTAYPILYMIQVKERIWGFDEEYGAGYAWINFEYDHEEYTDEELIEYLNELGLKDIDEWDLEDMAEENGIRKCYYQDVERYKENIFFTEKAAKQHIKLNHYHYNRPQDYVIHAWRNPEMESVIQALKEIVKE